MPIYLPGARLSLHMASWLRPENDVVAPGRCWGEGTGVGGSPPQAGPCSELCHSHGSTSNTQLSHSTSLWACLEPNSGSPQKASPTPAGPSCHHPRCSCHTLNPSPNPIDPPSKHCWVPSSSVQNPDPHELARARSQLLSSGSSPQPPPRSP